MSIIGKRKKVRFIFLIKTGGSMSGQIKTGGSMCALIKTRGSRSTL